MMKQTILLALTICLFATANAQKTKVVPAQTTLKTFVVSEETKKDLPEGVIFANNKISLRSGFKFEQIPNNGGVKLVNAKGTITGRFKCYCSSTNDDGNGGCTLLINGLSISCAGTTCCTLSAGIDLPKNIKMQ